MSSSKYHSDRVFGFLQALEESDVEAMRAMLREEPDLFAHIRKRTGPIFCHAGKGAQPPMVAFLKSLGADIDEQDANRFTGLTWAICKDRPEVVRALLEAGANPNLDCPFFQLANRDRTHYLEMAKMLLAHGADVNVPFKVPDLPDRNGLSVAIERGKSDLVQLLRAHGARLPNEAATAASPNAKPARGGPVDLNAEVVNHFRRHYGQPDAKFIREIVPTSDHPIAVHYISDAANKKKGSVLFTTGLSQVKLDVPAGKSQYQRAELMLALEPKWPPPAKAIKDIQWGWPIQWLRRIASRAASGRTWLGDRWSVLTEEDRPKPLAPGVPYGAWILSCWQLPEAQVTCTDGTRIQIYQLFPLFSEEFAYERKHGAEALVAQFMKHDIQLEISPTRRNVALKMK